MVGACSTTSVQVIKPIAPPPASLMVKPPTLLAIAQEEPTPEEAIEIVLYNYGLYHGVAAQLMGLQNYVDNVVLQKSPPESPPEN